MNLKTLHIGLFVLGLFFNLNAQEVETKFSKSFDVSAGVGLSSTEDFIVSLGLEWSSPKAVKNINPFINVEYGRYTSCLEYINNDSLAFSSYCQQVIEKHFWEVLLGLSFYGTTRTFEQSGLVSQVGISYRLGLPEFKSISLINSWSYKFFISDQFYVSGGPVLDFGFVRPDLATLDSSKAPPYFSMKHRIWIGYIL